MTSRTPRMLATGSHGSNLMDIADVIREGIRDPLRFFVLSYLLGSAMCGACVLVIAPLRRMRRRTSVRA